MSSDQSKKQLQVLNGEYFSYWSYNIHQTCPAKFLYLCVNGYRPPETERDARNAYEGAVVHNAAETWYKAGSPLSIREFYRLIEHHKVSFLAENRVVWKDPADESRALTEIDRQATAFLAAVREYKLVAKNYYTEHSFRVRVHPELVIGGRIDLLLFQKQGITIADWKGVKTKSFISVEQLKIYSLAVRALYKRRPVRAGFLFTRMGGADWYQFTDQELDAQLETLLAEGHKVRAGQFPGQVGFHCRWCDAKAVCPDYKRVYRGQDLWKEVKSLRPGEIEL